MSNYKECKSWLEEEISEEKSEVKEPGSHKKIDGNRRTIGDYLTRIGFSHTKHISADRSWGTGYSFEQYKLSIKKYNMEIICAIGSDDIYVAVKDLELNDVYKLFEYNQKGTYRFANNPEKIIEEFKFLLKHYVVQFLNETRKENITRNFNAYNLAWTREKSTLNVFQG